MAAPTLTLYANRPRIFFRDTDKTTLQNRIADASGWKPKWDATFVPWLNGLSSDGTWVNAYHGYAYLLAAAGAAYITETSSWLTKAKNALLYLCTLSDTQQPTDRRERTQALAWGLDILWDSLTTTQRATVAAELYEWASKCYPAANEEIDGHSGRAALAALIATIAGWGVGSWNWSSMQNYMLDYFWKDTPPTYGRLETYRYFHSDGEAYKGSWYCFASLNTELWLAWVMGKATTNVDLWTSETWCPKIWEGLLWEAYIGGQTKLWRHHADTWAKGNSDNPLGAYPANMLTILAEKFPTPDSTEGGKHLFWIYEKLETEWGTNWAPFLFADVIFFDRGAWSPVAPKDAATPPANTRLFQPDGAFFHRDVERGSGNDPWDYDLSTDLRASFRRWYNLGHHHCDVGGICIVHKGDPVLLSPGSLYDSYAGDNHRNAYQRSWLHSCCPLVYDAGGPGWTFYSSTSCINDGGQQYKKYLGASDPGNVYKTQYDAAGKAWERCIVDKYESDANGTFISADLREAYKREWGDADRFSVLKTKMLVIEPTAANGLDWFAVLVYVRIVKTTESWPTAIPLHTPTTWTLTSYGAHALGYHGDGKLWVDIRDKASYTITNRTAGTPLDSNGYGPTQFVPYFGSSANHKPSRTAKNSEKPWIKKSSLFIEKTQRDVDERYVFLLMPTDDDSSEPVPSRAWVTDVAQPDYYGITIGSSTYLIHRTLDKWVFGGSPDTTPPAEVTGLALTARDQALGGTWTDPVDSDFDKCEVWYRTSAVT